MKQYSGCEHSSPMYREIELEMQLKRENKPTSLHQVRVKRGKRAKI